MTACPEIARIAYWCGRPVDTLSREELVEALNVMAAEAEAMRSRHRSELDFAFNFGVPCRGEVTHEP